MDGTHNNTYRKDSIMNTSSEAKDLLLLFGLNVNSKNLDKVRNWDLEDGYQSLLEDLGLLVTEWNRGIIDNWLQDQGITP